MAHKWEVQIGQLVCPRCNLTIKHGEGLRDVTSDCMGDCTQGPDCPVKTPHLHPTGGIQQYDGTPFYATYPEENSANV